MKRFIAIVSLFLLAACGGGSGSSGGSTASTGKIAKMNISDAASLVIYPGKTSSNVVGVADTMTTTTNSLFKITKDGYLLQVTIQDETGKTVTTSEPTAVYNVNGSYVVVCFGNDSYLVSKSDGKVYNFAQLGGFSGPYRSYKNLYSDNAGNIYYLSYRRVVKVTISGANITAQYVSPVTDSVNGFTVDQYGTVFYPGRMIAANGTIVNISSDYQESWIAPDGNVYIRKSPWISGQGNIFKVVVNSSNNSVSFQKYGELNSFNNFDDYLELQNRLISFDIGTQNKYLYAHELFNPTNTPRDIPGLPLSTVKTYVNSDNYYYVSGNDTSNNPVLLKIDPTGDSYTYVLPTGQYDVYKMTVSKDDQVVIYALRMSDGANIVASISNSGQLTVLDQINSSSYVVLEAIN
jgi:hypothetical protein